MITVPTLQVLAGIVIGLFLIQVGRHLTAQSDNRAVAAVNGGLDFLVSG